MGPDADVHGRPLAAVAKNRLWAGRCRPGAPGEKVTDHMAQVSHGGWGLDQGECPGRRARQILDDVEGGASKAC